MSNKANLINFLLEKKTQAQAKVMEHAKHDFDADDLIATDPIYYTSEFIQVEKIRYATAHHLLEQQVKAYEEIIEYVQKQVEHGI